MNDPATPMHVVESHEYLLRDLLDEVHGDAFVLVALDETEQILAQHFEDHADVRAVGPLMAEMVEERDDMGSAGMGQGGRKGREGVLGGGLDGRGGGGDQSLEQLDLVERSLGVSWSRLDDLERDMAVESGAAW